MNKNIINDYIDFDAIFKSRLENLTPSNTAPSAENWNLLESKITKSEVLDAKLDTAIKTGLNNLSFETSSKNWEAINAELEDLENADSAFDALFSQKLKSIPTEFNPEHWRAFEPRINFFLRWQMRIKKYRVLEAAIFILTIFPVLKLYDAAQKEFKYSSFNAVVSSETQINNGEKTINLKNNSKQLSGIATNANQSSIWSGITDAVSNLLNKNERSKFAIAASKLEGNASSNFSPLALLGLTSQQVNSEVVENKSIEAKNAQSEGVISNSLNELENKIWLNRNTQVIKNLPIPNLKETRINLAGLVKTPKNIWRAGIVSTVNVDEITTHYILNGDTRAETFKQPSWSTGSVVSLQRGNTEIEAGIIYSNKTYQPNQTAHISGTFDQGYNFDQIKDVSAHLISIPVNVKQNLFRNKKLRIYALGGSTVSTVFAVDENRKVNDNFLQTNAPTAAYNPGVVANRFELPTYANSKTITRPMVSLNFGAGVEYQMNKRVSVFAQPVLKYQISSNGIGSLNDKINTLSVEVGIKTTL